MSDHLPGRGPARFVTTRWSLVLAAVRVDSVEASAALEQLCELYWRPVYAFIRRTGRSADDAADLTQSFFAVVLEKGYFGQAKQDRGRFRSFLLTAVKHFLSHEFRAAQTLKRGGGRVVQSLDADREEAAARLEPSDVLAPDDAFERRWAEAVVATARRRLRDRHAAGWMKGRLFAPLSERLFSEDDTPLSALAASLPSSEGSLRVMMHRLREGYGQCLRDVIADTVGSPEDVDDELRYLLRVLSARPSRPV